MTDRSRPDLRWVAGNACVLAALAIAVNVATDTHDFIAWLMVATMTATSALVQWMAQRWGPDNASERKVGIGLIVFSVAAVFLVTWVTKPDTRSPAQATPKPPSVISKHDSYQLLSADEPSLTNFCPKDDKLDLDSGKPGHGGQVQLGDHLKRCRTEGELAELILERTELHTPDNKQLYVLMDRNSATGYEQCVATLAAQTERRSRLTLAELNTDDRICVQTDKGNVALVTIRKIEDASDSSEKRMTIAYTTWHSQS